MKLAKISGSNPVWPMFQPVSVIVSLLMVFPCNPTPPPIDSMKGASKWNVPAITLTHAGGLSRQIWHVTQQPNRLKSREFSVDVVDEKDGQIVSFEVDLLNQGAEERFLETAGLQLIQLLI